jgi:hypothetical protein
LKLSELARAKGLPSDFLVEVGVKQLGAVVQITYLREDGSPAPRQRLRTAAIAKRGSRWNTGTGSLAPYGLWRLNDARGHGKMILCEGESDAWTAWYHGFPCLGLPGAETASLLQDEYLRGIETLLVVREPDEGGERFVSGLVSRLQEISWEGEARVIQMPSGIKDLNDLHRAHLDCPAEFKKALRAAVETGESIKGQAGPQAGQHASVAPASPDTPPSLPTSALELPAPPATKASERKKKQATILLELARERAELFHTPDGVPFATIQTQGHQENWPLGSREFRSWLRREFYALEQTAPAAQATADALNVLDGVAQFDGAEHPVFIRKACVNGVIYLDLGDHKWHVVEVSKGGWRIVAAPTVKFRRAQGMLPLPMPVPGGSIEKLREFVNLGSEDDFRLLIGWLMGALGPDHPYPVLDLCGEQGSAKSTTARVVRRLVDPNKADLRREPKDSEALAVAANNGYIVALDNLSGISQWLSDGLCCLATGGGFSARRLYTNEDEVIFEAMRPVILTGIGEVGTASDLLDRTIPLQLPRIEEGERQLEEEFWQSFEMARPHILGGLLDVVAEGLRRLPGTRPGRLPRMADFARWVTACESALGWAHGSFLASYWQNRGDVNSLALEGSLLASPLRELVKRGEWSGTCSELLTALSGIASEEVTRRREWPKIGRSLSTILRKIAPNLRSEGIEVEFSRSPSKERSRIVTLSLRTESGEGADAEGGPTENSLA